MNAQATIGHNQPEPFGIVPGCPDYAYTEDFTIYRLTPKRGTQAGRPHRHYVTARGYIAWNLRDETGRPKTVFRSAIVCTHFHGPRPEGMGALHWDGNPQNDTRDNLRWGTPTENMHDMVRHGRAGRARGDRHGSRTSPHKMPRGESHSSSKLTVEQVDEIRQGRETAKELAARLGVTSTRINQIRRGIGWQQ